MIYPSLVPDCVCTVPIEVWIDGEHVNKYGEPEAACHVAASCNYQDSSKTLRVSEKEFVQISGSALFNGDLCPDLATIPGGYVEIFGERRNIVRGAKNRNPDGSVNYTRLDLE